MADNEILKDAELEEVVGGSGVECMGLLQRLKDEGLYAPKTPLVAGNERAAAKELQTYLDTFKDRWGLFAKVSSDDTPNRYIFLVHRGDVGRGMNVDELIQYLKDHQG